MPIFVPATSTRSWRDLQPKHHWKHGYSAKSLADHWQDEDGFPSDVRKLFTSASVPGINDAEMLFGVPEWKTKLPGKGRDSQTDLFVVADSGDGLISIAVEGKVAETFGDFVDEWFRDGEYSTNHQTRLEGLCNILEIEVEAAMTLRYQLLHRTASALLEAKRFSATTAIMLVHSFSSERKWFEDYKAFGAALDVSVEYGQFVDVGMKDGVRLLLGWLNSPIKEDSEVGD